ncbi:cytochrome P450 [Xylaria curta]|nr:cytochrome P450 [Xylaria curta]
MAFFLLLVPVLVSLVYVLLRLLDTWGHNPQEPPLVRNSVPFIGPILKMMRYKTRREHGYDVYTLRVLGSRIYVVNSISLVSAVQKHYRTINWAPYMGHAISWITGTNKSTNDMMAEDMISDKGFCFGIKKSTFAALSPGPYLDALNTSAIRQFADQIDVIAGESTRQISLFPWVRHQILVATTDAIYGPHNPFRCHSVREAWDFYHPGIPNLGPKALPDFLTSKSIKAREHVVNALVEFFEAGYHHKSSELLMARYNCIVNDHNVKDLSELARLELAGAFASIENTVPTTFWFIYRIFSDPIVLQDCKAELLPLVRVRNGVCHVDVDDIKDSCPIFQSTLHETIRYHSVTISARKVTEDCMLDKYLLKQGSTLLISATVPHFDKHTWGADVGKFNHTRFSEGTSRTTNKGVKRTAFRGFGGGFHLCPGRHFSVTEMLSLAAMMILRFDLTPVDGTWETLKDGKGFSRGTAALIPHNDFPVTFQSTNSNKWKFFVSGTG